MTSQIPFTPLTPEALARLTLDEQMAFLAATGAVAQDQKPSLEVTATVVLTVQRLIGEAASGPEPGSLGPVLFGAVASAIGQHMILRESADQIAAAVLVAIGEHARIVPKEPAAEHPRPGDQQLPVPNDGPSMHDLVVSDLDCWPESDETLAAIRALLEERKRIGLERYGSLLQAGNGRDARRDLIEELADAVVYAHQVHVERGQDPGGIDASVAYEHIAIALGHAVQIPEADHG